MLVTHLVATGKGQSELTKIGLFALTESKSDASGGFGFCQAPVLPFDCN